MCYQVVELSRYPIKSMGQVALTSAVIDRFGIEMDRRWMLVDKNNQFLTQRTISRMSTLVVTESLSPEGGWQLQVQGAHSASAIISDRCFSYKTESVQIWDDLCEGRVANDEINHWLSKELGVECRLVFMDGDYKRFVDAKYAVANETVSFADGFPLLLTTESSLSAFNQNLSQPINMARFRPNIVITGNEPYAEDQWKRIRVGTLDFSLVKPCSRCAIPTINPDTLKKESEVFKALKQTRSRGKEVYFGQNLLAHGEGVVSVGDSVEILE